MATNFPSITDEQAQLIENAPLFFVASADPSLGDGPNGIGPVNISPKGAAKLHVLSPNRVAYLDYIGSGNETARHAAAGGPVTVMICSFDHDAAIVRLFGTARAVPPEEHEHGAMMLAEMPEGVGLRPRQIVEIEVVSTVTSCGYGVPVMRIAGDRMVEQRGRRYKVK